MEYINKNDNEHWNDYWSQGHTTSFGSAFVNGYEGVIKSIWEAHFNSLKANSQVLDLCTGNASLLRLAKQSKYDMRGISFTGVDYATISNEDGFADLEDIHLKFGINIENMPFPEQSFNYVISNFGIEYSELSRSIAEAARVLVSGGELFFVSHCHDSILIKNNGHELEMLIKVFQPHDVLDSLTGLIDALTEREIYRVQNSEENKFKFEDVSKKSESFRLQLNKSIGGIADTFSKPFQESDFLGFLKYLLSPQCDNKQQALKLFKADLHSHKARLTAMVNAALSKEQLDTLKELFKRHKLSKFSIGQVVNDDGKVACRISAVKD